MSFAESSLASQQQGPFGAEPRRFSLNLKPVIGLGLVGLGLGLVCLGIFHGFEHGSCSTTGYSRNYGPVPHCGSGTGWWMLMLTAGLVVAGAGAVLARSLGSLMVPLVFVAIGAPFVALGFGNHGRLVLNVSSGTGKTYALIFGGAFVIAGLIWGAFAARRITGLSGGSLLTGVLAAAIGVGAAFAIASGVSSAIGKAATHSSVQIAPGVTVLSPAAERARQIALCRTLVAGQHLISAHDKALLTAECATNWKAAEHQLPAAARRAALAYAASQCKRIAGAAGTLPASSRSTIAAACANPASGHGPRLRSIQAQLCEQIVRAQVPVAAQPRALAACPKS